MLNVKLECYLTKPHVLLHLYIYIYREREREREREDNNIDMNSS